MSAACRPPLRGWPQMPLPPLVIRQPSGPQPSQHSVSESPANSAGMALADCRGDTGSTTTWAGRGGSRRFLRCTGVGVVVGVSILSSSSVMSRRGLLAGDQLVESFHLAARLHVAGEVSLAPRLVSHQLGLARDRAVRRRRAPAGAAFVERVLGRAGADPAEDFLHAGAAWHLV